jgi:hypothetical protein
MKKTYIFYSCDQWKTNGSGEAKFLFADNHKQRVLDFIKLNIDDYFSGDAIYKKQQFNAFKELVNFKGSISEAINTDTSLYAMCEEIKPITEINN